MYKTRCISIILFLSGLMGCQKDKVEIEYLDETPSTPITQTHSTPNVQTPSDSLETEPAPSLGHIISWPQIQSELGVSHFKFEHTLTHKINSLNQDNFLTLQEGTKYLFWNLDNSSNFSKIENWQTSSWIQDFSSKKLYELNPIETEETEQFIQFQIPLPNSFAELGDRFYLVLQLQNLDQPHLVYQFSLLIRPTPSQLKVEFKDLTTSQALLLNHKGLPLSLIGQMNLSHTYSDTLFVKTPEALYGKLILKKNSYDVAPIGYGDLDSFIFKQVQKVQTSNAEDIKIITIGTGADLLNQSLSINPNEQKSVGLFVEGNKWKDLIEEFNKNKKISLTELTQQCVKPQIKCRGQIPGPQYIGGPIDKKLRDLKTQCVKKGDCYEFKKYSDSKKYPSCLGHWERTGCLKTENFKQGDEIVAAWVELNPNNNAFAFELSYPATWLTPRQHIQTYKHNLNRIDILH